VKRIKRYNYILALLEYIYMAVYYSQLARRVALFSASCSVTRRPSRWPTWTRYPRPCLGLARSIKERGQLGLKPTGRLQQLSLQPAKASLPRESPDTPPAAAERWWALRAWLAGCCHHAFRGRHWGGGGTLPSVLRLPRQATSPRSSVHVLPMAG
jgi:hypothetical protein